MRILIITELDEFYLPLSIDCLLRNLGEKVVKVICARNPLLPGRLATARKFYGAFGLLPVFSQGLRLVRAELLDSVPWLNFSDRDYSVKRVCEAHNTPYSYVQNINAPDFLQHCRELNVDLIASVSPTQIFKDDLISLPERGCINIHTAKLPKYRGLYPTYWAMACGEKTVGVSIHYIEKGIDTGRIILQDEVDIPQGITLDYMLTVTKTRGAELMVQAIQQIEQGTVDAYYAKGEGSYFSFPTPDSYRQFKNLGYKLW